MKKSMMIAFSALALISMFLGISFGQSEITFEQYIGTYKLVTPADAAAKTIKNAIEAATKELNLVKRPIAQALLKRGHQAFPTIEISRQGLQAVVKLGNETFRAGLDGKPFADKSPDGQDITIIHMMFKGKFVQHFKGEKGMRANTFSLDSDGGGSLTLSVNVTSPQLPKPVKYTLHYKK